MFAKTTNVDFAQRVVATLVASAMLLSTLGAYINTAQAASLADVKDTLSTSNPGVKSAHTFQFTIPSGLDIDIGELITVTFPTAASEFSTVVSGMDLADITMTIDTVGVTEGGYAEGSGAGTEYFSFTSNTAAVPTDVIVIAIPSGVITNPTATSSYEIVISTADGDIGKTRVAIVDTVLVTAEVQTTFDFIIEPLAAGFQVSGVTASTTGLSGTTTLDYGVLTADVPEALGQRLNVTTNANKGFVVTVETDGDFQSANGAIIDVFDNGSNGEISGPGTSWAVPDRDISDELTWGHWGVTSNDSDLTGGAFAANQFMAASTTPRVVFTHDGPADGSTQDMGQVELLYRVEITPFQEAADDYSTTLTYIATPTF